MISSFHFQNTSLSSSFKNPTTLKQGPSAFTNDNLFLWISTDLLVTIRHSLMALTSDSLSPPLLFSRSLMNLICPDSHFIDILIPNRNIFLNHTSANHYFNHYFASNLSVSFSLLSLSPSLSLCLSIYVCLSVSLFLYYHSLSCHHMRDGMYLAKPYLVNFHFLTTLCLHYSTTVL